MSLGDWCDQRIEACPLFLFWSIILQLELEVMIYVKAILEGDFLLYTYALTKIVPWFFALGHTNYARWMDTCPSTCHFFMHDKHPGVFAEFRKGNVVVKKTTHVFSGITIDQAHEQNNASVNGDSGAVGVTENHAALRRWMVSGPEMARLIADQIHLRQRAPCPPNNAHYRSNQHK